MGFLGALGKILSGKPVFEAGDTGGSGGQATSGLAPGQKSIPTLRFGQIQCDVSGTSLQVWADIQNSSSEAVFLDKIILAGKMWELDTPLQPGESRQFKIYDGPLFQQPPRGYAQLQYRKQSDGDYFETSHELRTQQQGQMGYLITNILGGHTKDI